MITNEKASVPVAAPSANEVALEQRTEVLVSAQQVYKRNDTYSDVRMNDGGDNNFGIE